MWVRCQNTKCRVPLRGWGRDPASCHGGRAGRRGGRLTTKLIAAERTMDAMCRASCQPTQNTYHSTYATQGPGLELTISASLLTLSYETRHASHFHQTELLFGFTPIRPLHKASQRLDLVKMTCFGSIPKPGSPASG